MKNLKFALIFFISACSSNMTPLEKNIHNNNTPMTKASEDNSINISRDKNCICPQLWMPVCGENGKTYSNSCFAKCAEVKYKIGSCEKTLD